jgi:hypothetical protein
LYGFETVIHGFRLLRRIFGPKRDKETGDWRKLYNEDLHNVIYTTDELTIGVFRLRSVIWAWKVALIEVLVGWLVGLVWFCR